MEYAWTRRRERRLTPLESAWAAVGMPIGPGTFGTER
jgi:hypothetical protein